MQSREAISLLLLFFLIFLIPTNHKTNPNDRFNSFLSF